jgi:hypothetical protein
MNTIPVMIRPQLIPFLFKEFEGNEASYMEKKIKSVRFLPSSSLTKYLYNQIDYSKKRGKQDEFIFFLTIEQKSSRIYTGVVYVDSKGLKEPLMMDDAKVNNFNNLLEDIFRISFVNFIDGYLQGIPDVTKATNTFIDKYDLLEVGLNTESLRLLYYREKQTNLLSRLQNQSSNRVANYT